MRTNMNELPHFDLSNVVAQMRREDPATWMPEVLAAAEQEYRRFLLLSKLYPNLRLVPSRLVDAVWHRHILNTARYAKDCKTYLGRFLHHNPQDGAENNQEAQTKTFEVYAQTFGSAPGTAWTGESGICDAGGCDGGEITAAPQAMSP